MTPKPKFHRLRNQMNSSSKKMSQTNYFPRIFGFPSAMSHIHKSTKMRFPGNQPKMPHLHRNITSSEMVVRGWYMTYFDRRYLTISKKIGLGWFPRLTRPPRTDSRFFRIFSRISSWATDPRKPISWTSESEKNVRKLIFSKCFEFSKKYETWAPFWYVYIWHTPSISKTPVLGTLSGNFSILMRISLFWKPLKLKGGWKQEKTN